MSVPDSDLLLRLARQPRWAALLRRLGLPAPVALVRTEGGWRSDELAGLRLAVAGPEDSPDLPALIQALQQRGASLDEHDAGPLHGVVLDARLMADPSDLDAVQALFPAWLPRLAPQARVLLLGPAPGADASPRRWATARALEGFMRSLGKEIGRRAAGINLLTVADAGSPALVPLASGLLAPRSGFIAGQVLHLGSDDLPAAEETAAGADTAPVAWPLPGRTDQVLAGQTVVVTGAAQGIGAATARRLAEEGAHVVCVDLPTHQAALEALAASLEGASLALDITDAEAGTTLADTLLARGGVDVVVHNAGITRDRTLARLPADHWRAVLDVNLQAAIALDDALDAAGAWRPGARTVCLSSINGIAGAAGQTHYAASKAGVIGYVQGRAIQLAGSGAVINAVAPGFIETAMTARLPWSVALAGRRLSSLSQGGQPRDVAEAVALLAQPLAGAVNGQVLRVCGQSFLGA